MNDNNLRALASKIKAASDLWGLHHALIAFESASTMSDDGYRRRDNDIEGDLKMHGIDICELPTFGGPNPKSTDSIWSWDEDHILTGEGPFTEWEIRVR